jgi:arylsulfatase A-like enzyme
MPLLHVPLVVSLPGQQGPKDRLNVPVSLRDLPATVMDLVGLEHEFPGTSWRSSWESGNAEDNPLLFEVEPTGDDHPKWSPLAKGPMKSLVDGDFHYIRNGDDSEEFYNYVIDPGEQQNLAMSAEHAERLTRLREFLNSI